MNFYEELEKVKKRWKDSPENRTERDMQILLENAINELEWNYSLYPEAEAIKMLRSKVGK